MRKCRACTTYKGQNKIHKWRDKWRQEGTLTPPARRSVAAPPPTAPGGRPAACRVYPPFRLRVQEHHKMCRLESLQKQGGLRHGPRLCLYRQTLHLNSDLASKDGPHMPARTGLQWHGAAARP